MVQTWIAIISLQTMWITFRLENNCIQYWALIVDLRNCWQFSAQSAGACAFPFNSVDAHLVGARNRFKHALVGAADHICIWNQFTDGRRRNQRPCLKIAAHVTWFHRIVGTKEPLSVWEGNHRASLGGCCYFPVPQSRASETMNAQNASFGLRQRYA